MKQTYSPKEVALAIGVSESSLKRWADDGKLQVVKTMGGHRRISFQEAIRFTREAQLPLIRPDVLGLPELAHAGTFRSDSPGELLFDLLIAGRADDARVMLLDLYLRGMNLPALADGPIFQAMRRVGELWHDQGAKGVFLEHRATDAVTQAITALRALVARDPAQGPDDRPVALGGCPSKDMHQLATTMIAAVLAEAGFRDMNLGADTPIDALIEAIRTLAPRLVWLSSAMPDTRPTDAQLLALLQELSTVGGVLVVGGRGFELKPAPATPRMKLCATMTELSALASGVLLR